MNALSKGHELCGPVVGMFYPFKGLCIGNLVPNVAVLKGGGTFKKGGLVKGVWVLTILAKGLALESQGGN